MPRFITKKWVKVDDDQSGSTVDRYKPSIQIRFKTSMLRSDLFDFSDAYIVVNGTITVTGTSIRSRTNRPLAFKNNAPFIIGINTLIDNTEDLVVVMPLYNLIEHSKNYRKATGSLWNCYRDELTDDRNNNNIPDKNVFNSKSFKYKTSVTGSTYNVDANITNAEGNEINSPASDANKSGEKKVEIVVPLKYQNNLWRALNMPLINCEVSLILNWSKECITTRMERRVITNTRGYASPTNAAFQIKDTKLLNYQPKMIIIFWNN